MSWKMIYLNNICRPRQWKTLSLDKLDKEGYPVYGANGKIGFYKEFTHELPTLTITCRGATCGSVHITEPKSYINGNAMALDDLLNDVDIKFLFYYFQYRGFIDVISGSAQPQITGEGLSKVQVPLPPLPIQQRIAEILDAADALRRKDQELLRKYDELAQAIFIDMFGDPVKNEKGWEVKTIGESIDFMTSGSRGWAQYYTEEGDLFLRINNVGYNEMKLNDTICVTAPNNAESVRTQVQPGDILLSITADLGRTCVIPNNFPKAFINQHLAIIRLKNDYEPNFISQVFASEYGRNQFKKLNKGGVKAGLNFEDIKSLEFINPPIELQNRYKDAITELNKQKNVLDKNLLATNNLFDSLLQQAFKGELVK